MDYRDFLSATETAVLPYFGGTRLEARERRLRLASEAELEPGWWRFSIEGRRARPLEPAEPPALEDRPAVRGHVAAGWLFWGGGECERFALPPAEEPEPLAPCTGRRWHGGELLFDAVDFEDEAEDRARRCLEDGLGLAGVKGVPASLRAAFGFAVAEAAGRELGVPVSPREASRHVLPIAEGGREAAIALLRRLEARRAAELRRQREAAIERAARSARPLTRPARRRAGASRADEALEAAGARMLRSRRLATGMLEVTFRFLGERFVSVVHPATLGVLDAGICLSGADRELTLESLPSAIREAIETGQLYITRR